MTVGSCGLSDCDRTGIRFGFHPLPIMYFALPEFEDKRGSETETGFHYALNIVPPSDLCLHFSEAATSIR